MTTHPGEKQLYLRQAMCVFANLHSIRQLNRFMRAFRSAAAITQPGDTYKHRQLSTLLHLSGKPVHQYWADYVATVNTIVIMVYSRQEA